MIPRAHVTHWRARAPWPTDAQVEQDLVLSRALVELFGDPGIAQALAFRGGTALHKLFFEAPGRYSEDIDLVQRSGVAIGHVIAMWGDTTNEDDHHAWAHYTGVVIVEHLASTAKDSAALRDLRDAKWRTLTLERKELEKSGAKPGFGNRDSVLAWLATKHVEHGPAAIGDALNELERAGKLRRINRVRYYALEDLRAALGATRGKVGEEPRNRSQVFRGAAPRRAG